MSNGWKILFLITFIALVFIGALFAFFFFSPTGPIVSKTILIEAEYNTLALAQRLKREGVIRSVSYFRLQARFYNAHIEVVPGAYRLEPEMNFSQIVNNFSQPEAVYVELPRGLRKEQLSEIFTEALAWSDQDRQFFPQTYAGMEWLEYQSILREAFKEYFEWDELMDESFMALSSFYVNELDFLVETYVPGRYLISTDASRSRVGALLINRFKEENFDNFRNSPIEFLDEEIMNRVNVFLREEVELLPDLVALPATDLTLEQEGDRIYLKFTTKYWNGGQGPLELIADPATRDMEGDVDRDVYQRVYRNDGSYRDYLVGTFMWHEPHLHYHFTGFADYELSVLEGTPVDSVIEQKTTFCVRDTEPFNLDLPGAPTEAAYNICGKEKQGISRGWADVYYFTYADQNFDVTDLPTGNYKLSLTVNPNGKLQEIDLDNNVGEVIIRLDMEAVAVEVLN